MKNSKPPKKFDFPQLEQDTFQVHFRHIDPSPSLSEEAKAQCLEISKTLINHSQWQITFEKVRHEINSQIEVQCSWGLFTAEGTHEDYRQSLHLAVARLETQLLKEKSKLKNHKKKHLTKTERTQRDHNLLKQSEELGAKILPFVRPQR